LRSPRHRHHQAKEEAMTLDDLGFILGGILLLVLLIRLKA